MKVLARQPPLRREQIPEECRDVDCWPDVDVSALSEKNQRKFARRVDAVKAYLEPEESAKESVRAIAARTGIDPKELRRMVERCLTVHPDGRIFGKRGLLPGLHIEPYQRTKVLSPAKEGLRGGSSGAFGMLLENYSMVSRWLDRQIEVMSKGSGGRVEVSVNISRLHQRFLTECKKAGVTDTEYPFTVEWMGRRSLADYVPKRADKLRHQLPQTSKVTMDPRRWGDDPNQLAKGLVRPYQAVEFDGHKIDGRFTIRVPDPNGFETILELRRIWVLAVIEVATSANLGYVLVLSREYNRDDVAAALQAALAPHTSHVTTIPALRPNAEGGFPSIVIPETAYACWDQMRFDAAKCHFAAATLERATHFIGCWTDNAVLGDKNARSTVEQFFTVISTHFAHRLPGTTGNNPQSVERMLNDPKGDLSLLMTLDELEQVIEVVMSDSNARRLPSLSNQTPLEAMKFLLARQGGFLRTLANDRRQHLNLLQEKTEVAVRGNRDKGSVPHVNFSYVRYSSQRLSGAWSLIGKAKPVKLRIYFDVRDIRYLRAYTSDGQFFDTLIADRPWCFTSHSLSLRQAIFRLYRKDLLKLNASTDPISAYWEYLRAKAPDSRAAASEMAKVLVARTKSANEGACLTFPSERSLSNAAQLFGASGDDIPPLSDVFTY